MAVSTLKRRDIPSWEYVGNVYWWENSWTCPADGFAEVNVAPSGSSWYWYIKDSTAPSGWSHCLAGANTYQQTLAFFVKAGSMLSTADMGAVRTARADYYKFV